MYFRNFFIKQNTFAFQFMYGSRDKTKHCVATEHNKY